MTFQHSPAFISFAHAYGNGVENVEEWPQVSRRTLFEPLDAVRRLYGAGCYESGKGHRCVFEFGYVSQDRIRGAVCARWEDRLCAGVYSTTYLQFLECASCAFLHPTVYPKLGYPTLSATEFGCLRDEVAPGFYWEATQNNNYFDFLKSITNKCLVRERVVRLVVAHMLEFYWLHEAAHLHLGHTDIWLDKFGEDHLEERTPHAAEHQRAARVTREKQADATALTVYLSKKYADQEHPVEYQLFSLELRIFALFLLSCILIWQEHKDSPAGMFGSTLQGEHIHAVERYDNIVRVLEMYCRERVDQHAHATKAWSVLGMPGEPVADFSKKFNCRDFEHAVNSAWASLHVLSEAIPAFQALEHFRLTLQNQVERSRATAGHDNLLSEVLQHYQYR